MGRPKKNAEETPKKPGRKPKKNEQVTLETIQRESKALEELPKEDPKEDLSQQILEAIKEHIDFEVYDVEIEFITEMLGTIPKNREVYTNFIASKDPEKKSDKESIDIKEEEEKGWTGFFISDEYGVYIMNYMIKGFLKNAGNVLKDQKQVKALRKKITDFVFISPRHIRFGKDKPDGQLERPLRAETAQGPRVTLARSDFMDAGNKLRFQIRILDHKEVRAEVIKSLMFYGQFIGLGQFRTGGYGGFIVTKFEKNEERDFKWGH